MTRLLAVLAVCAGCATETPHSNAYSEGRLPGSVVTKTLLGSAINVSQNPGSAFKGNIGGCTFNGAGRIDCLTVSANGTLQNRDDAFRLSIGSSGTAFLSNASPGSNAFSWTSSSLAFTSETITGDASTTITLFKEDAIAQKIGTGAGTISLGGGLASRSTPTSNVSTGETDLHTLTLQANTMVTSGHCVLMEAWGTGANNINTKTLKAYFGTTAIFNQTLAASVADTWHLKYGVCRTGANAQRYTGEATVVNSGTNLVSAIYEFQGTTAETETNALVMKMTGTSGTASNDITENQSFYWFF